MEIYYPVGQHLQKNIPIIKRMALAIQKKNYDKLVLVATGSSGAIIAALIANEFVNPPSIMYIHKKKEDPHYHSIADFDSSYNFVFVDDFVRTGDTIRYIAIRMKERKLGKLKAIYLSCDIITRAKAAYQIPNICKTWIFVK